MKKIVFILIIFIYSCSSVQEIDNTSDNQQSDYNLIFTGSDYLINNPNNDRRAYYKIFIDKLEVGRTTTGLESQKKIFEYKLNSNRHLLVIEKWILDEKEGKYIKLNNIDQPKPNFYYFNIIEKKRTEIIMKSDNSGKSTFDEEYKN